ncbi:hypothetical protein HDU93_008812 [Gonapodya sp. JEL0774]|nr:hypothetical protein HDU93_008812 [Gonapodya sp. JEL0774]
MDTHRHHEDGEKPRDCAEGKASKRQRLEPTQTREQLLGSILFRGDTSDICQPKTERIAPPTSLLGRLDAFLPQLALANEKLLSELSSDPTAAERFDIEQFKGDGPYVEMNLGLGVFDVDGIDGTDEASGSEEIRFRPVESEANLSDAAGITSFFQDLEGNVGVEELNGDADDSEEESGDDQGQDNESDGTEEDGDVEGSDEEGDTDTSNDSVDSDSYGGDDHMEDIVLAQTLPHERTPESNTRDGERGT